MKGGDFNQSWKGLPRDARIGMSNRFCFFYMIRTSSLVTRRTCEQGVFVKTYMTDDKQIKSFSPKKKWFSFFSSARSPCREYTGLHFIFPIPISFVPFSVFYYFSLLFLLFIFLLIFSFLVISFHYFLVHRAFPKYSQCFPKIYKIVLDFRPYFKISSCNSKKSSPCILKY